MVKKLSTKNVVPELMGHPVYEIACDKPTVACIEMVQVIWDIAYCTVEQRDKNLQNGYSCNLKRFFG